MEAKFASVLYNAFYSCFQNGNILIIFLLVLDFTEKAASFCLSNTEVDVEAQGRKSKLKYYSSDSFLSLFFLFHSLYFSYFTSALCFFLFFSVLCLLLYQFCIHLSKYGFVPHRRLKDPHFLSRKLIFIPGWLHASFMVDEETVKQNSFPLSSFVSCYLS
jgi:hypothetical protein